MSEDKNSLNTIRINVQANKLETLTQMLRNEKDFEAGLKLTELITRYQDLAKQQ